MRNYQLNDSMNRGRRSHMILTQSKLDADNKFTIGSDMSTRKSRLNTDSPTPNSGSTESVSSTPSTPSSRSLRSVRKKPDSTEAININLEKNDDEEEAVKVTEDEEKSVDSKSDDTKKLLGIAATRKRRITLAKEESNNDSVNAGNSDTSSPTTDDGKNSPSKLKRSRRSAVEIAVKELETPRIGKRRNSTGKIDQQPRKLSSRIKKLTQMRKANLKRTLLKKPEKVNTNSQKPLKQAIEKLDVKPIIKKPTNHKTEKNSDSASDSELLKMPRRRSDSISKCSDMTDTSSFLETKESEEMSLSVSETSKITVKQEQVEKDDELAVNDGENDSKLADADDKRLSRRLKRKAITATLPQKMNTRSRSETPNKFDTSAKIAPTESDEIENEIADEKIVKSEIPDEASNIEETEQFTDTPTTTVDKESIEENDTSKETENEKSMSPDLVSEGVSEISVKQFYGRPDFLENNLGIEKDPKLGEIMQVQEKIKCETNGEDKENNKKSENDAPDKENEVSNENVEIKSISDGTKIEKECDILGENNEISAKNDEEAEMQIETEQIENGKVSEDIPDESFVKPREARKDSTSLINENLLLNGEIEVRPKEKKSTVKKAEPETISDVVLYKITNGMRVNPEKLETVLESQKQKEKDERKSDEDVEMEDERTNGKIEFKENVKANVDDIKFIDNSDKIESNEMDKKEKSEDSEELKIDVNAPATSSAKGSRSSSIDDETAEDRKQKESHLKHLGLLTHQAAEEATIEKQKRREQLKASLANSGHGGKGKKQSDYTGTLKTVIKLHRGNNEGKKKGNQSLKMTLHKGRAKNGNGNDRDSNSAGNSEEDTYYIQSQDIDGMDCNDALAEEAAAKEHEKLLVIPEKASSFRYHPEKLCEDQCFYCGGKFGLFDTPCHVAQIKSIERQKKILENEEKLTVDSCLCDACFRHVDRRANCPSYKKRLSAPPAINDLDGSGGDIDDKAFQPSISTSDATLFQRSKELSWCQVAECSEQAIYGLRRKWAIKLRKTISKSIPVNFDITNSLTFIPICDKHCDHISHMIACVLCNQKLKRNTSFFINKDSSKVEPLLSSEGIPVVISSTSVVCKLCLLYVNLLLKPQEGKANFVRDYTNRLLEYHKMKPLDEDSETDSARRDHRSTKRTRKSSPDLSQHSDDSQSAKVQKTSDQEDAHSTRLRQKTKLIAEQQRVEQRVQQEQLKLKQKELLAQRQPQQDELRQQQMRSSNEDISILRTNPNISMRELFPGEDELGLNVSIPFSSGSWRTPDGWSKVTSTVQYDEPTRALWEELQKPYGNQSSFLRHLILLEKYFRNGDLVLASSANLNAVTYAESVQQRLQSYDNIPPRPICISQIPSAQSSQSLNSVVDLSHIPAAKSFNVPNSAVTITKTSSKSSNDSTNSLLKSSANATNSLQQKRGYTISTEQIIDNHKHSNKSIEITKANASTNSVGTPKNKSSIGLPPELICINTSTPNDKHQQQLLSQKLYETQMQLTLQQHLQSNHQNSLLLKQQQKTQIQPAAISSPPKKSTVPTINSNITNTTNNNNGNTKSPTVVRLSDTLSEAERLESKHWRPKLMPVTAKNNINSEYLYQTADGRKLPSLVQVHSGGKPYMISIQDYNRMCIVRRERIQEQLIQKGNPATNVTGNTKATSTITSGMLSNGIQSNATTSNGLMVIPETNKSHNLSKRVQIPNNVLEENSLIPLNNKSINDNISNDSLLKIRKSHTSLLKTNQQQTTKLTIPPPIPPNASVTATVIAPNNAKLPMSLTSALSQSNVVSITSTPSISAILAMNTGTPSSTPPPIQLVQQPITITTSLPMINNVQNNPSALEALFKTTNQVTTTPTTMLQWAESLNKGNNGAGASSFDNSTKSILSKIPKSLTVIPQQKRPSIRGSDENS